MDIYDALEKDHRTFERLLDKLTAASKQGDEAWKSTLDELRREVVAHSHAEEAILYNALRAEGSAEGLVLHSYTEHATAEAELRTLSMAKLIDVSWTSLAEKLSRDLRHHIQEEERDVFAAARKAFSAEEAKQMASAFQRLKKEMRPDGDSAMASSIDLMANLLPPRLSKRFREIEAQRAAERSKAKVAKTG